MQRCSAIQPVLLCKCANVRESGSRGETRATIRRWPVISGYGYPIMLDTLFLFVNLIPVPYWLLMIVLPRHPYTRRLTAGWAAYALLGLLYTALLGGAVVMALTGGGLPGTLTLSLDGVADAIGTPSGVLIVWTHIVTFDLFVGVWVYQESQRLRAPRWIASVCLFFTMMSGPFGLLLFLLWRSSGAAAFSRQPQLNDE